MFLDNVVKNAGQIKEPWRRLRIQGNSYFLFSICFFLVSLLITACIGILIFVIARPDISQHNFGTNAICAISFGIPIFSLWICFIICALLFLDDFIIAIMLIKSCRVLHAWNLFLNLLKSHLGSFALYLLFKIVLVIVVGALCALISCLFCCIAIIPYLGTVLLLPLLIFMRSYSVHFLGQFGEQYCLFKREFS